MYTDCNTYYYTYEYYIYITKCGGFNCYNCTYIAYTVVCYHILFNLIALMGLLCGVIRWGEIDGGDGCLEIQVGCGWVWGLTTTHISLKYSLPKIFYPPKWLG